MGKVEYTSEEIIKFLKKIQRIFSVLLFFFLLYLMQYYGANATQMVQTLLSSFLLLLPS